MSLILLISLQMAMAANLQNGQVSGAYTTNKLSCLRSSALFIGFRVGSSSQTFLRKYFWHPTCRQSSFTDVASIQHIGT